jgi:hypothetical protein
VNSLDVAILGLFCTLLGAGLSKLWVMASQFTTFQGSIAKGKQDVNNLGMQVRSNDKKANRRYQQMVAALLDTHADQPAAVERFGALLRDDSWD